MTHKVEWSNKYATGIPVIDEQHQRIFQYLDEIDQAIALKSKNAVQDVVIGLLEYSVTHNAFEEELMQASGYPQLHDHQGVHDAFRRRAEDYVRRISSGDNPVHLARQIRNDINLWISGHILHEDMRYVPYMKESQPDQGLVNRLVGRFFKRPQGQRLSA